MSVAPWQKCTIILLSVVDNGLCMGDRWKTLYRLFHGQQLHFDCKPKTSLKKCLNKKRTTWKFWLYIFIDILLDMYIHTHICTCTNTLKRAQQMRKVVWECWADITKNKIFSQPINLLYSVVEKDNTSIIESVTQTVVNITGKSPKRLKKKKKKKARNKSHPFINQADRTHYTHVFKINSESSSKRIWRLHL